MNWRAISAIIRKDLKVVMQNKGVSIPIIVVPLVFFILFASIGAIMPKLTNYDETSLSELTDMVESMPSGLQHELSGYTPVQQAMVFFMVYMFAPMFLIIPLMVSSVIAADSFAGEKERKTLEALLYTPTTDRELFLAKLLSGWLSAMAVALVGFILYAITANAAAWSIMGRIFFPNVMWIVLVLWVVPAAAGFGMGVMVLVSARAQGFQDAYQLGGLVVLPILLLVFGQIGGLMYFSVWMVLLLGLILWAIDALLIWLGGRNFKRDRLMTRI